jgi:hypothetical protein
MKKKLQDLDIDGGMSGRESLESSGSIKKGSFLEEVSNCQYLTMGRDP